MQRTTYKRLKEWVAIHNDNWSFKVTLSAFNDCYYIYDADTHETIASGTSPQKCWDDFYQYRKGYCRALDMIRKGKVTVE